MSTKQTPPEDVKHTLRLNTKNNKKEGKLYSISVLSSLTRTDAVQRISDSG